MRELCGYCKKNSAFCSYFHNIPICDECLADLYHKRNVFKEKEATTMQVTYNGFTGELVKLEATYLSESADISSTYNLPLFDREKRAEISFTNVKLEDMKFLGGAVSFDG